MTDEAPDYSTKLTELAHWKARAERAEAELGQVRALVLMILDDDQGFVVGEKWDRETGKWSKHDRCVHGRWRHDGCDVCMEEAIRGALWPIMSPTEETRL